MSFTKVAPAGIGTEPGDGYRIGDSFLHSTGINLGSGSTISHSGNATFTGIITAASFSGSGSGLTGVASTDNIKTSTTANFTGGIQVGGAATFTGDVGIGGTLTYEDVSNIDSVGIITARTGVIVGSGVTLNATGVIATGIVTASSYRGDGSQLTGITGTTINNNADNRIITGSGTANTLNAESELTWDGSLLTVDKGSSGSTVVVVRNDSDTAYSSAAEGAINTALSLQSTTPGGNNDQNVAIQFNLGLSGQTGSIQEIGAVRTGNGAGALIFRTRNSSEGRREKLRITSGGRLGLGLASPQAVMHIEGGSEGNLLQLSNTNTGATNSDGFVMGINSTMTYLYNRENKDVTFGTNNLERVRIDSSGRVRLTTTSSPQTSASSSADDLVVSGDGAMGMTLHTNSTNQNCSIYFSDTSDADVGRFQYLHNNNQFRMYVNANGTPVMQWNHDLTIYFNGNMYSNGNAYSTGSDLNMKSNLVRFTNAVDKLKQITGYAFDIKCGGGDKTRKSGGVIAQDVEKVYPEFVEENPETGMKSIEYNTLIGVLVEAVKELTTKVETLESKI